MASQLLEEFDDTMVKFIPREENQEANEMAQLASGVWIPFGCHERAFIIQQRTSTGASPFALTYEHDAVLPMKIVIPSLRISFQEKLTPLEFTEAMMIELEDLDEARITVLNALQQVKSLSFSSLSLRQPLTGIPLSALDDHTSLDLAIHGADEVDLELNLVKGRGLGGSGLVMPVEVVEFCSKYNLIRLQELFKEEGCDAKLRADGGGKPYITDNSNYIVDLYFKTPIKDFGAAGKEISAFEGVVEHGLFLDVVQMIPVTVNSGENGLRTSKL
ncbi:hypothetical protein HHK36_019942 [Tetracentron sinense]|uniref:ribose-5-phosphate isomerase n=1 Tax=Tetracentron sinense TaxID=13715 RepID=A0A834YQP9_TETSI|nr:hypothetical protein HHK36_019942 [Tetracentron sinense]